MRIIIREASKFGGSGWLSNDAVFRKNQEGSTNQWNVLDASLRQVYIANLKEQAVAPYAHCYKADHTTSECVVTVVLPNVQPPPPVPLARKEGGNFSSIQGKEPVPYRHPPRPICHSWNTGGCNFRGTCAYAHVCTNYYGAHPASSCMNWPRATPPAIP